MKRISTVLPFAILLAAQQYQSKEQKLPRAVAPQPVPFSHRTHASANCVDCHTTALRAERAGIPQPDRCMLCHRGMKDDNESIRTVGQLLANSKRIPWERVYRVPEYVFFSHKKHTGAKIGCDTCHGPVASREVLEQELPVSMASCMNCHTAKGVSNECGFCHALGY